MAGCEEVVGFGGDEGLGRGEGGYGGFTEGVPWSGLVSPVGPCWHLRCLHDGLSCLMESVLREEADISYPVPPEVGKVGKESPTFIQPVSERSDGIKSFFNKQSPAKTKIKAEPETTKSSTSTRPKESVKDEIKEESKMKVDPEGIKSEITPKDEEEGLGDDSNAPNPDPSSDIEVVGSPDSKSKAKKEVKAENAEEKEEEEKEDLSTTLTKRKRDEKGGAGQRTKVIRRDDDSKSAVCLHLRSRTPFSHSIYSLQGPG
jgi:hypothetical protein